MLSHKSRLRSRDIRFLTRKRQYFTHGIFGFFYVQQYPNLHFNQFSFHVSIKYSKHATTRNKLKRTIMNRLRDHERTNQKIASKYRKIFIVLNKNMLEKFPNLSPGEGKTVGFISQEKFENSFNLLINHLGSKK